MASRIGLRLQLMRDQLQQEERRERQQQQQQQQALHCMQSRPPLPTTPAINAPAHYQAPMQVPMEVLMVSHRERSRAGLGTRARLVASARGHALNVRVGSVRGMCDRAG